MWGGPQRLVLGFPRLDSREREHRIEQHRGVAHREHEPIAVRPDRIVGIEAQELLPQTVDDRSHGQRGPGVARLRRLQDRKSTRLNSSHSQISYAVFCLKKKNLATFTELRAEPCAKRVAASCSHTTIQ